MTNCHFCWKCHGLHFFLYIKRIYKLITVNAFGMFSLQNMLQATKAWGTFCYVAMFWQLKAYEGFRTDCVKY